MTYNTLSKICAAISISPIVYMFLITYEGTYFGWTVFFVFLALSILFHTLDEQEKEIATLRSPKPKEDSEEWKKYIEKKQKMEEAYNDDPFSQVPDDPANPRRQLLTKMQQEMIKKKENNDKKHR